MQATTLKEQREHVARLRRWTQENPDPETNRAAYLLPFAEAKLERMEKEQERGQ